MGGHGGDGGGELLIRVQRAVHELDGLPGGLCLGAGAEAQSARKAIELVDGPLDTDEQLAAAVAAVTAHPVMERAWEMTRAHAARAKQILAPLPDSAVKDALAGFADYVVDRSS